jgi:hypothetical protein
MNRLSDRIYELLPAVYRINDAKEKQGEEALKALLEVIAEQIRLVEDDIGQLYDNWFIETCAEWLVPYIGDLLGVRGLYQTEAGFTQRARVANTLAYRRRKGTATMLEQLAYDTTRWHARAAEFFQLLETTQYINHLRPANLRTPNLRQANALELLDGPFDKIAHTADVRHIASRRGKYNIPNVGLYLWRLQTYMLSGVRPRPFPGPPDGRFTFSPLGNSTPLFNRPRTEATITHLAEEPEVPNAIRPGAFYLDLQEYSDQNLSLAEADRTGKSMYYGQNASLAIMHAGNVIPPVDVVSMDLSTWARPPARVRGFLSDPITEPITLTAGITASTPAVEVSFGGNPKKPIVLSASPTTVDEAARLLTEALREEGRILALEQDSQAYTFLHAQVVAVADRLFVLPGGPGMTVSFSIPAEDPNTRDELKLDPLVLVDAAFSSILKPFPKLASGNLNLTIAGIGPHELALSSLPTDLFSARAQLESAIHGADTDPAFQRARVLIQDDRLLVVPGFAAGAISAGPVTFTPAASDPAIAFRLGLKDRVGVDVRLGRIAFPLGTFIGEVRADFAYGFSGDLGGGPYDRRWVRRPGEPLPTAYQNSVAEPKKLDYYLRVSAIPTDPAEFTTISDALDHWANALNKPHAVIEICDNETYKEDLSIEMDAKDLIIQAENKKRPVLFGDIIVTGSQGGRLALNGLLIAGAVTVEGTNSLYQLDILHSTLVPGGRRDINGQASDSDQTSLEVKATNPELKVNLYRAISGPIHLPTGISSLEVRDSILESPLRDQLAWVSPVLVSGKVTSAKIPSHPPAQMTITIGEEGPYPLTLSRPRGILANQLITPSILAACLKSAIHDVHETPAFQQAQVLREGTTLIVLPGTPAKVSFAALGDSGLIDNLGLDPGYVSERVALVSGPIRLPLSASSPALDLTLGTESQTIFMNPPVTKAQVRVNLENAIRDASHSPAFENAIVAFHAEDNRLAIVPGEADVAARFHTVPIDHTTLGDLSLASDHFVIAAVATGEKPAPPTSLVRATVLGQVHVKELSLASEAILNGRIHADRRQSGCVRFSFVTDGSRTPRCYRCQPELEIKTRLEEEKSASAEEQKRIRRHILSGLKPSFTSTRYGHPAYCQLSLSCPDQIRTGAEDGGEMGAFYFLKQPQREGNLLASLDEYLRVGLEAGIFYVT